MDSSNQAKPKNHNSVALTEILEYYQNRTSEVWPPQRQELRYFNTLTPESKEGPWTLPELTGSVMPHKQQSMNYSSPSGGSRNNTLARAISQRYTPSSAHSGMNSSQTSAPYGKGNSYHYNPTLSRNATSASTYSSYPSSSYSSPPGLVPRSYGHNNSHDQTHPSYVIPSPFSGQVIPTPTQANKQYEGLWLSLGTLRTDPKQIKQIEKTLAKERKEEEKREKKQRAVLREEMKREMKARKRD